MIRFLLSTYLLLVTLGVTGLHAQTPSWNGTDEGFLGERVSVAETSARIASWEAETGRGILAVRFVYPEPYHQIDSDEYFTLVPQPVQGIVYGKPLKQKPVYNGGEAEYYGETTVILEFHSSLQTNTVNLTVEALFQLCNEEGICLLPDSEMNTVLFNPKSKDIAPDKTVQEILEWNGLPSEKTNSISTVKFFSFLLLALVGGFLFNLMPCILPLLSVKALSLVNQADSSPQTIRKNALLYTAGIELSFWILALLIIFLQASGRLIGWGFQLQSPIFVFILSSVIWIFSLSLFDVFIISQPRIRLKKLSHAAKKESSMSHFLTGVFAVFVATPCTAPLLGSVLGFAFSQPPLMIFIIFSTIGLGLSLPFLFIGFQPKFISRLPKPGPFLKPFRALMGFLLMGNAVYMFIVFTKLVPGATADVLWWIFAVGFSAWVWGQSCVPTRRQFVRYCGQILSLLLIVGSAFFLALPHLKNKNESSVFLKVDEDTIAFNEDDLLSRLARNEPVFLEFTADWCTTCKINQPVIKNSTVQEIMKRKNVVHIKADLTAYNETMIRWLKKYNRVGVPLYLLYRPGEVSPYIFPTLLRTSLLKNELNKLE